MKTIPFHHYRILFILWIAMGIVAGCNKESSIGLEILPQGDLISVKSTTIKDDVSAYTRVDTPIRTDEPGKSLLGSFTDSLFGNTTIHFATQFRLTDFPDFGTNPKADSIKLYLYYRLVYGDTVTPQKFRVFELESPLDVDATYKQDIDLKSMASDFLLGETEYTPRIRIDSATADTFYQAISIRLDNSLAEKLIRADSMQMLNNDAFLQYFKGLLVETEKVTGQGGTILSLETIATSTFQGSALALFYHNDDLLSTSGGDSAQIWPYLITRFSARVNRIEHDYTEAPFYNLLNSESRQDSLIYIQATGGLKSKITIEDLSSWADSAGTAINKAEIIFQIDTLASQVSKFPPPKQLLFTVIDSTGTERLPVDYVFNPDYYGGTLQEDYTYHFNITQHLQRIIEGLAKNNGFFLTPANKNSEANRVVIKGATSQTGIRLIITYSKFSD